MYPYHLNANVQPEGEHEVHLEGCHWMPEVGNRLYLGLHTGCASAVMKARGEYPTWSINGCVHCSAACHTG